MLPHWQYIIPVIVLLVISDNKNVEINKEFYKTLVIVFNKDTGKLN